MSRLSLSLTIPLLRSARAWILYRISLPRSWLSTTRPGTAQEMTLPPADIRLIANPANVGFAAAVNQGVRATTAPLVLLLNPDAVLVRGLDALEADLLDPETGAVGGLLIDSAGVPQAGFMARNLPTSTALIFEVLGINSFFPRNPVNWHYRCLGLRPCDSRACRTACWRFFHVPAHYLGTAGGVR